MVRWPTKRKSNRRRYDDERPNPWYKRKVVRQWIAKTSLCLLTIAIIAFLVWSAYFVFLRKEHPIWGLSAIVGAIAILVKMAVVALSIKVLRSEPYARTPPGFGVVLAVVAVVVLVLAFSGVQPLSGYKDDAISSVKSAFSGDSSSEGTNIATVESINTFGLPTVYRHPLFVTLKPTENAKANAKYIVELYEKGKYRASMVVVWNQPELNVLKAKVVEFALSEQEVVAYMAEPDLRHIFSVKLRLAPIAQ